MPSARPMRHTTKSLMVMKIDKPLIDGLTCLTGSILTRLQLVFFFFSGNAFDYPAFTTAFDSIICENVPSNKDRLYFLDKYTTGKANEVVKGFLNSEHLYTEARKLFD